MSGAIVLNWASQIALGLLIAALVVVIIRLVRGPGLSDRILALDLIAVLATAFVGVLAVFTGFSLYIDIAIALALVSFLSTVALSRYLMGRAARQRAGAEDNP